MRGTQRLPREPRVYWDLALIPLTRSQFAIVDPEDIDLGFRAWCHDGFYAVCGGQGGGKVYLHRKIAARAMALIDGAQVDHINGDKLDCRRANLRAATVAQNAWNSGARATNTSGRKGVTMHAKSGKWQAQIQINGKHCYLGLFSSKDDAAAAYAEAARKHHGEFARPR